MEQQGISRRTLIKGSVAAGGLVWAAPTLMSSASASHGSHCDVRCQTYCRVKIDPSGGIYRETTGCDSNTGGTGFSCPGGAPPPGATVETCCGGSKFTVTGKNDNPGAGFTIRVTDPLCKLMAAFNKQGTTCTPVTITDCATATFVGESSHIEFLICCQTS